MNDFQQVDCSQPTRSTTTSLIALKRVKAKWTLTANKVPLKKGAGLLQTGKDGEKVAGRRMAEHRLPLQPPRLLSQEIGDRTSFLQTLILPLRALFVLHFYLDETPSLTYGLKTDRGFQKTRVVIGLIVAVLGDEELLGFMALEV